MIKILSELVRISPYLFVLSPAVVKNVNLGALARDVLRRHVKVVVVEWYLTGGRVVISSWVLAVPLVHLVRHVQAVVLVVIRLCEEWSICCQVLFVFFIQSQLNVATGCLATLIALFKV